MAEEPTAQEKGEGPPALAEESKPIAAPQQTEEGELRSQKVTLADLFAKGDSLYASRKYEEASEVFSEASNLQAEINGETAPENAEVLFHYGQCLFKVGQSKSNVLGGKAPAVQREKPMTPKPKPKPKPANKTAEATSETEKEDSAAPSAGKPRDSNITDAKKPFFSFTGDENFDESDEDEEGDEEGGDEQEEEQEEEEDEDDLSIAFEILDLARVCYLKQLDALNAQDGETGDDNDTGKGKGKEGPQAETPAMKHIKERLADTHDLLAEISLENEKYPQAIEDGRTSLTYKLELYPEESEVIAEAHFKLSLALEFASVTTTTNGEGAKKEDMDQGLRDEAIKEMELAIKSFKLKLQNKEVELATMASPEENDMARTAIGEMKEVIADMDQRLVDLKAGPIDTQGLIGAEVNPLGGILGAVLGESASETKARVDQASKGAVDLTNLVRKKKTKDAEGPVTPLGQNGSASEDASNHHKRKASATVVAPGSPKKTKVEEEAG